MPQTAQPLGSAILSNEYTRSDGKNYVRIFPFNTGTTTVSLKHQAGAIQNHKDVNVRHIGKGEARHRKYKRLKLGVGQAYDRASD
jgi:hypothetical protein